MGNSSSKTAPVIDLPAEQARQGIPRVLEAKYVKSWKRIMMHLGEPGKDPLFVVDLPEGQFGSMVLHGGPDLENPAICTSKGSGKWQRDHEIQLPAIPSAGVPATQELVRHDAKFKNERYWFALAVGQGATRHIERFEWRHSSGDEVKGMGQSRSGMKLVRIPANAEGSAGMVAGHGEGYSSDGLEVVAVFAYAKLSRHMTPVGEFQFMGSGATGELGVQWSIMAVMSFLCSWQKVLQAAVTS